MMLQASPRMQATLEPRDKEDTSSVSSDKYEKDVNILNRNTQLYMALIELLL